MPHRLTLRLGSGFADTRYLYNCKRKNKFGFVTMAEGDDIGLDDCSDDCDGQKEQFLRASQYVQSNTDGLSTDQLLYLYARYKQSNEGTCKAPKPAFYDIRGRQKWDAWNKLGDLSEAAAMRQYVERVRQLFPNWDAQREETRQKGLGPVMSTLQGSAVMWALHDHC